MPWSQYGMRWAGIRPWRMGRIQTVGELGLALLPGQMNWSRTVPGMGWHCHWPAWGQAHVFSRVSCLSPSRLGRAPDTKLRHTGPHSAVGVARIPGNPPLTQCCHSLTRSVSCPAAGGDLLGPQFAVSSGHFHTVPPALRVCSHAASLGKCGTGGPVQLTLPGRGWPLSTTH